MFSIILFRRSQFLAKLIPTTATYASNYCLHLHLHPSNSRQFSTKKVSSDKSITISYFVNSCGLSQEDAEKASIFVDFSYNPENPNLVLALFKQYKFSQKQIAYVAKRLPRVFSYKVEKTLLPKFNFFTSIGLSATDIAMIVSFNPYILARSLERKIIPNYKFFKGILDSDEKVVAMLKRSSRGFANPCRGGSMVQNAETLQKLGVPKRFMALLVRNFPETLSQSNAEFCSVVEEVLKMGFDVSKSSFVTALHAKMGKSNRATWDRCRLLYKKWGWSEDEVLLAFRKFPCCMLVSKKNLMETMDYFVNVMGLPARSIAHCSWAITRSLEKKIKRRYPVIRNLLLKGFYKKELKLGFLVLTEKDFLERYVKRYKEQLPNLLAFYEGKIDVSEL